MAYKVFGLKLSPCYSREILSHAQLGNCLRQACSLLAGCRVIRGSSLEALCLVLALAMLPSDKAASCLSSEFFSQKHHRANPMAQRRSPSQPTWLLFPQRWEN